MKNFTLFLLSLFVSAIGFGQTANFTYNSNATDISNGDFDIDIPANDAGSDGIPESDDNVINSPSADGGPTYLYCSSAITLNSIEISSHFQAAGFLNNPPAENNQAYLALGVNGEPTLEVEDLIVNSDANSQVATIFHIYGTFTINNNITLNRQLNYEAYLDNDQIPAATTDRTLNINSATNLNTEFLAGRFTLNQTSASKNYDFVTNLDVSADFELPQSLSANETEWDVINVKSGTNLILTNNLVPNNLSGILTIESGAELNLDGNDIDGTLSAGQVVIDGGAEIHITEGSTFPTAYNSGYVVNGSTTSEFIYSSTASQSISDQSSSSENFVLGDLRVNGGGTLTIGAVTGIGNGEFDIRNIYIDSGAVILDANASYSNITVSEHGTLQINESGSFTDFKVTLEAGSTIIYNKDDSYTLPDSDLDTYYNLVLNDGDANGTSTYTIASDPITIIESLTFGTNDVVVDLQQNITLESTISQTAYIGEVTTGSDFTYNGGEFIAKKYLDLPDYIVDQNGDADSSFLNERDYSLPIENATFADLSIFYATGVYSFVEDENSVDGNGNHAGNGWVTVTSGDAVTSLNGGDILSNGFRIYYGDYTGSPADFTTISSQGEINHGNMVFDVTNTNDGLADYDGWNLLGNPYPSDIDLDLLVAANGNFDDGNILNGAEDITPQFYYRAPDDLGDGVGDNGYCNYNANNGVNSCRGTTKGIANILPAFQGFWLETDANSTFTLQESHKFNGSSTTYKNNKKIERTDLMTLNLIEDGHKRDRVIMISMIGGTIRYNKSLDSKSFGGSVYGSATSPGIQFFDGKQDLDLIVKTLPGDNSFEQVIKVNSNGSNNQSLNFVKPNELNKYYNCFYLVYNNTGEHINIDTEEVNIELLDGVNEHQFTLVAKNDANYLDITKIDATCYGNEDGLLNIKGHDLPQNYYVNIYKDGELFDNFNGEKGSYKKSVVAGEYTMKVNGISKSCTYNYVTTVESNPEIISNFDVVSDIETGFSVEFTANSENAVDYEWTLTNTGETFFGQSFSKTFERAGKQWLKLRSIGENENCFDEINKEFYVAQGSVDITESEFFNAIDIKAINNNVKITGLKSGDIVTLHTLDGKLLNSGNVIGQEINLNTNGSSTVIVTVETGDNKYSKKINL